jgi:predicted RNA-binding protein Jag
VSEVAAAVLDKRAQVEQLLGEIFRLADWPARLELKDAADGGIAVAVHFDGEVPGVTAGKKSYLVESLQFLVNKVVNRPNAEKRWVTLGVGGFPEPKVVAVAPAPAPSAPPKPSVPKKAARDEEAEPEVQISPEWKAIAAALAAKAVKHGRTYAVMSLEGGDRSQLVKAGAASGVKVRAEGEGHFKRVAFVPEKETPMPRKMQFPDDEEDDEEG